MGASRAPCSGDGAACSVLALGESGDGRAIALGVDGTHLLQWSELGERGAGRAYGALWEGLVGWLMRDPRYESARLDLTHECRSRRARRRSVSPRLPGAAVEVKVSLDRLGTDEKRVLFDGQLRMDGSVETGTLALGVLDEGAYTATVRIGNAPPARFDFACERGGAAFADSRPDPGLLERISHETGGVSLRAADAANLIRTAAHARRQPAHRRAALAGVAVGILLGAAGIGAHGEYARRRAGLI